MKKAKEKRCIMGRKEETKQKTQVQNEEKIRDEADCK